MLYSCSVHLWRFIYEGSMFILKHFSFASNKKHHVVLWVSQHWSCLFPWHVCPLREVADIVEAWVDTQQTSASDMLHSAPYLHYSKQISNGIPRCIAEYTTVWLDYPYALWVPRYVEGDMSLPYKCENQQCPPIPYIISQSTAGRDISLAFHLVIATCSGIKKSPWMCRSR